MQYLFIIIFTNEFEIGRPKAFTVRVEAVYIDTAQRPWLAFYQNTIPDDKYCIIFETSYVYEILLSRLVNTSITGYDCT